MHERSITITTGTIIKAILIIGLAWAMYLLRDIVLDILTAITIASAIEPAVKGLHKRKVPRVLSVIIVYVSLLAIFFGIFYSFLPLLVQDFGIFISTMPTYINAFQHMEWLQQYEQLFGIAPSTGVSANDFVGTVQHFFNTSFFSNALSTAGNIFGGIFSFVIILVFSFYFAVQETGVDDFLRIVVPAENQRYVLGLWRRSQHKIGLWMQGQLLLGVIMGTLVFLGLTILGVPNALLLAVIAACFEIIPVFGPTLSAVPAVALALAGGGFTLGLLTVGLYVVAQQFENHLIYPLVVTRVVGVPPLLVILALIIGGELAGFLGIILSVPLAATLKEFVRDIEGGRFRKEAAE